MNRTILRKLMTGVLVLLLLTGSCAQAENETVWLQLNEYKLSFSGEITAGTQWKTVEDTPQPDAVFYLQLREDIEVPLFTLTLMQDHGDYAANLTAPDGGLIPVSFEMAERPPGLTDEEKWAFSWAQADVYVLMETLALAEVGEVRNAEKTFRIVTDAYELTCSARWESQLRVIPDGEERLCFQVVINGAEHPLFTIAYDNSGGDYVITVLDEQGARVNLSFYMFAAPEGLDAQERRLFYSAQEVVNEIAKNIVLR